jgi:hypothetical protein
MAVVTKFASRFGGFKGFLRRGGFVAGIALYGDHRIMNTPLQKFCLQRRMRVVTTRAYSFVHGVIAMGLFKRRLTTVMAA